MKLRSLLPALFLLLSSFYAYAQKSEEDKSLKYHIRIENDDSLVLDETYPSLEALRADADRLAEYGVSVDEKGRVRTQQNGGGRQSVMIQQYSGDTPPPMHKPAPPPAPGWGKHGHPPRPRQFFRYQTDSTGDVMHMEVETEALRQHMDSLRENFQAMAFLSDEQRAKLDSLRQGMLEFQFDREDFPVWADSLRHNLKGRMHFFFDSDSGAWHFDDRPGDMRTARIEDLGKEERKQAGLRDKSALQPETLSIYANPAHSRLIVRFRTESDAPVKLRIHSMDGKELYSSTQLPADGSYRHEADLRALDAGNYALQLEQEGKSLSRKLILE